MMRKLGQLEVWRSGEMNLKLGDTVHRMVNGATLCDVHDETAEREYTKAKPNCLACIRLQDITPGANFVPSASPRLT